MLLEDKLMPLLYRGVKIITVSNSSKHDILDLGLTMSENIEVINPGVEKGKFKKLRKTKNPTFVYLGRLQHYKNIDVAINAFAKVHQDNEDAKLIIAGFGESLEYLKALSDKHGLNGAVDFAGFVSEKRKKELLACSWVALQPSSYEGWGITVIEANASGTPVIASRTKGLSDSVIDGETGILVPVGDTEEMTRVMASLIVNPRFREKLAKNAFKWSKNFSWDDSSDRFLRIVKEQVIRKRERQAIARKFATVLRSFI
jgi:glycosyltransferase involved in cell wall biosynthesis